MLEKHIINFGGPKIYQNIMTKSILIFTQPMSFLTRRHKAKILQFCVTSILLIKHQFKNSILKGIAILILSS